MSIDRITCDGRTYECNLSAGTAYEFIPDGLWAYVLAHNPIWQENLRRELAEEAPPYYRGLFLRDDKETVEEAQARQYREAAASEQDKLNRAQKVWEAMGSPEFDVQMSGYTFVRNGRAEINKWAAFGCKETSKAAFGCKEASK